MREKEYSEWMSTLGLGVLRHANCCKIAFNGGWESRQTEVDELQEKLNFTEAQLGIQIDRCKAFGQELTSSRNHGDDLQKRVDAAERLLNIYKGCLYDLAVDDFKETNSTVALSALRDLEQALKGGSNE